MEKGGTFNVYHFADSLMPWNYNYYPLKIYESLKALK